MDRTASFKKPKPVLKRSGTLPTKSIERALNSDIFEKKN